MQFYAGKSKETYKLLNTKGRQVLAFGTPLYRFKNEKTLRSVNFLEEERVIRRTNGFIPAGNRDYKYAREQINKAILQPVPETHDIDPNLLSRILTADSNIRTQYETYDPLRGNGLIPITVFNEPVYVFSAGSSLSTVVFTFATKKNCEIDNTHVQARFDNINIIDLFDLKYPIQQIVESPLFNGEGGVVGVRTTSTITMFRLENTGNDNLTVTKLHHFHLAEKTPIHPDIDYSMPCDLALSPFSELQYLFTTNNGFTALVDISRDELVFEGKDNMSDDLDYASRWRACSFAHIPSKYFLCSPECIKEWTVTKSQIHSKVISVPDDRIFGFTFKYPLLCYTTTKVVRIFDIRNIKEPIIDWTHDMRDGPPRYVFVAPQNDQKYQWDIGIYSTFADRLSYIQLYYNTELSPDLKNKVEVQDYFRFELPKNGFEPRYKREDVIHLVGLSTCLTKIPESDSLFYSIYRLFENGEIKVQYIILEKDSNKDKLQLKTRPNYSLHDDRFENLYRAIEVSELPTTLYKSKERTLAHIKKGPYRQYLEHIEEFNEATGPFSSSKKMDVAEHLVATNTPITYHELFGKDGYYNIELSDLTSHLNEMVPIEKAATLLHSDTLSKDATTESSSQFREQSEKLLAAHTKTIALSKIRIHRPSQNIRSFQYLAEDSTFNSTVSTRILAEEWTIDKTPAKDMEYKIFDEDSIPRKETFLLASSMKRRKSVSFTPDMGLPTISLTAPLNGEANFLKGESVSMELNDIPMIVSTQDGVNDSQHLTPQISSQVLPGRFGARVVKKPASKKKKKQKTSGFK